MILRGKCIPACSPHVQESSLIFMHAQLKGMKVLESSIFPALANGSARLVRARC